MTNAEAVAKLMGVNHVRGSIKRILMDSDPLLRTVSEPVTEFGDPVRELVREMTEALVERGGRGLAAIQIGVPLRVIIINDQREAARWHFLAMVNPHMARYLSRNAVDHEGCLSVPQWKWGSVSRPAKCDAEWFGVDGQANSATLTGETARIFQHELDHLNGVLMTDRIAEQRK
jgi:peptide deformylase